MKYDFFNQTLFNAIPTSAIRILDIGCDTGLLGAALKEQNPDRFIAGIEVNPDTANKAKPVLDSVFNLDLDQDELSAVGEDYDAIILGDIIEHLYLPLTLLQKLRALLSSSGQLYLCIPNIQHYSIIRKLFKGDFQYKPIGLLDDTHIRFYCLSNMQKLLLDAGFLPHIEERVITHDRQLEKLAYNIVDTLGYSRGNLLNMRTFQFVLSASKQTQWKNQNPLSLTFVVNARKKHLLRDNFLSSAIFKKDHPHQIIIEGQSSSAAEGLNRGFKKSKNKYIVFIKEEMYLPQNWDNGVTEKIKQIEQTNNHNWVAGILGGISENGDIKLSGTLVDRDQLINRGSNTTTKDSPTPVDILSDHIIITPKHCTQRFDNQLGFHLYGCDLSIDINQAGGQSYVLNLPCLSNEQRYMGYDKSYITSQEIINHKRPPYSSAFQPPWL